MTEEQRRELAARVSALMDAQGLTNAKLAQKAGLSEKTVSRVINSRHESRGNTIERIADALGIPEDELRPPRPAPLGLGEPTQLDRIEAKLDELLDRLVADGVLRAAQQDAQTKRQPARAKRPRKAA